MRGLVRFSGGRVETRPQIGIQAATRHKAESSEVAQQVLITVAPKLAVKWLVTIEEVGQRIDNFLFRIYKGVPRSHIYRVLHSGEVRINKGRTDQTYRLVEGDMIRIPPIRIAEKKVQVAPGMEFNILLEDDDLLVINKPVGVAVHGGSAISYGVIEQLRAARPKAKLLELVHRLDRDTSGILLLAKKRSTLIHLHKQMRACEIDKRYFVLVYGNWQNECQHVKLALHKYITANGERRVRVQVDGQASHTIFNLIQRYGDYALLEAKLKTGRMHQIRAHLSASGFAIAGDRKYGDFILNRTLQKKIGQRIALKRMFLHAYQMTFIHPKTGQPVIIKAPLPLECKKFLQSLSKNTSEIKSKIEDA